MLTKRLSRGRETFDNEDPGKVKDKLTISHDQENDVIVSFLLEG